ncbi:cellobiose phosphorylase [Phycicoccus sonneratiae]|uniref:Cellobiose phosphorylase n=1 Tax=Phycicoccus sonneratiae TaxID=2807628 RepID=A0ABS2CQ44_9MICO|nr:cellobiose phosphorylase [Phycicoccus sonneraticus]MBM6401169.1 cellobiose phosphorylase [Phycicoccus sonneraticus]
MHEQQTAHLPAPRHGLDGPCGLAAELTTNGSLRRFEAFGLSLLLYPATELEPGPAGLFLRVLDGDRARWTPLLGPASGGVVHGGDGVVGLRGTWEGLDWSVALRAGTSSGDDHVAWRWEVEVENATGRGLDVDVVLTHDPALATPGAVRTNEYYVAQYLDVSPLEGPHGTALAVRQNMPGPFVPWLAIGSLRAGRGWATDALQLTTRTPAGTRWDGLDAAALPSTRHQHEHTLVVLGDEPVHLAAGATHRTGFVGVAVADHPAATGDDDAQWLRRAEAETASRPGRPDPGGAAVSATAFSRPSAPARPLTSDELARLGIAPDGSVETAADGSPWSWSTPAGQVVLPAKDLTVLRPHGTVLRTGSSLVPDDGSLTTTVWMDGTFLSQVTRGHVGRDALLTGRRSYLGLLEAHGARLLVRGEHGWERLGTPSAWRVDLDRCTWWYALGDTVLEVTTTAPEGRHELVVAVRTLAGRPLDLLLALAGTGAPVEPTGPRGLTLGTDEPWVLTWEGADATVGDDAPLHDDRVGRDPAWVTLEVPAAADWSIRLGRPAPTPPVPAEAPEPFWDRVARALDVSAPTSPTGGSVRHVADALPWFAHDAVVHYLAPRGLEQYSGGAWGTRDVCQGPVGLLTALDRQDVVREVLGRVFRGQNARGDWPQAFEFLEPLPTAGQQDSHGDVVFWPLLATGEHLLASGDPALLADEVPFVGDTGLTDPAPVLDHLARAVERVEACTVDGSPLPAYGHGDWNDSLQPADPRLARRLVSVWTAVLQTQSLRTLAHGLRAVGATGAAADLAERAAALADATEDAIHRDLIVDDVMPGYLLLHEDGTTEPLVHPRDTRTGLTLGILPWIHAVSADLLTPEQAGQHLALVEEHLLGPDGARLFDRPVAYAGGPMSVFQRAEASTFWGREIGLMYVHAHLRYAEALARVGRGAELVRALALATPGGATELVPSARPRQTSCYYSSSDGAFTDRLDAQERYPELMAGRVPLEGGWRVYSSGPGLFLRLVVECLLGIRRRGDVVEVDPVLDPALGELHARVPLDGRVLDVVVRPGGTGNGVTSVTADGTPLTTTPLDNPYRRGGVAVRLDDLRRTATSLVVETF